MAGRLKAVAHENYVIQKIIKSAATNTSDMIKGIVGASSKLQERCTVKYGGLINYLTKLLDNPVEDLNPNRFITNETPVLDDSLSLSLLLYWCWWVDIVYYDLAIIKKNIQDWENTKYFNYALNFPGSPFFIISPDHISKTIVIAIRGTSSLADVITDASGTMVPFILHGIESAAHEGFIKAAENVIGLVETPLRLLLEKYQSYAVKVVGHSYGAAVASIVASILGYNKDSNTGTVPSIYPVRAILFSCPPVYNLAGALKVCQLGNQVTVVLGWDVVPRASLSNIQLLLCVEPPQEDVFSYVPGNIYWMTYNDDETKGNIYLIPTNSPVLQNINIHRNLANDHSLSRVYGSLLAYVVKND